MQKILAMSTYRGDMRSEAFAWGHEDGDAVRIAFEKYLGKYTTPNSMPVGLIGGSLRHSCYSTPLHAIGDGWRLLAPPASSKMEQDTEEKGKHQIDVWEWWFTKD